MADRAARSTSLGLFTTPGNVHVVEKTTVTRTFYLDFNKKKQKSDSEKVWNHKKLLPQLTEGKRQAVDGFP